MEGKEQKKIDKKEKCFVIMPISDPEGYEKGHFKFIYEDIFKPAIIQAGFGPKRADDDRSSSLIQVNIIRDIIEAPMAICDLSTRNPNVLFELGIRQAFDLPVVLVQEENTPRIFDISTINTIDYHKDLRYREVMEDREKIAKAIKSTKDNQTGVNSIIKLLEIGNAKLEKREERTDLDDIRVMLYAISNQISEMEKKESRLIDGDNPSIYEVYMEDYQIYRHCIDREKEAAKLYDLIHDVQSEVKKIANDWKLPKDQREELQQKYYSLIVKAKKTIEKMNTLHMKNFTAADEGKE